ncbi:MAG: hypothetical protein ABN482_01545 [Corticimicrobacter sp.]|uniref:hypothetical protein n=1 Tax=Corticimicrobacter sp. TaxID=2678536 RepID=UPI0032DB4C14
MKKYHWGIALVSLSLAGCVTTDDMKGMLDSLNSFGQTAGADAQQAGGAGGTANSLKNSPLHNVLRENLSSDGRAPEWPKIAVTNLQIPGSQMTMNRSLSLKANECIRFDAVLWRDAKRVERFKDLSLCASDLPRQSNDFVITWKSFPISGRTSGQVRTDGPTPPYNKLPSDQAMEQWILNQFGLYYVGSLLTLMGYDPNFTLDDRRFWIQNVKQ